jgi:hypothetical protein
MIERYILKELGFSLYNIIDNHPHKYILYFIKLLNGNEELANYSWKCLNDSMRLDISLKYDAPIIACAAIYLASHYIGYVLPERINDNDYNTVNNNNNIDDNDDLNNDSNDNKDYNNSNNINNSNNNNVHQITFYEDKSKKCNLDDHIEEVHTTSADSRANNGFTSAVTTSIIITSSTSITTTTTSNNNIDVDDNDNSLVSWWDIIGTSKKEILEISEQILELYRMEKVGLIHHHHHHHQHLSSSSSYVYISTMMSFYHFTAHFQSSTCIVCVLL